MCEPRLLLLTRDGCGNTPAMRRRLETALQRLGLPRMFAAIDVEALADGDVRRGYGTPTVLLDGRDLFGTPVPVPSRPRPT